MLLKKPFIKIFIAISKIMVLCIFISCGSTSMNSEYSLSEHSNADNTALDILCDESTEAIQVFRTGEDEPILVHNTKQDFRPYIHPILAPDGQGELTEFSPGHHLHQTGLYWGFTQVNGRDFFHHPEGDYWQRVSVEIIEETAANHSHGESIQERENIGSETVQWKSVFDLLGEDGNAILRETQKWSMEEENGKFILDLEWQGDAKTDITIGEFDYGGLFLRMPWSEGVPTEVINSENDQNQQAERQRAKWLNLGMHVEGRDDLAQIAIFDHPENNGFPTTWRVDGQFGVGLSRAIMGDWHIKEGGTEVIRHRLIIYTDKFDVQVLTKAWQDYTNDH